MKKIFYLLIFFLILVIGVISVLQYNGYFFYEKKIISPGENIEWEKYENNTSFFNDTKSFNSSNDYSIFSDIAEKIKEIEGIEDITYEIFISNNSIQNIIEYYNDILLEGGYSFNDEYSGIAPSKYFELYYYTYIKGFNGVVIFVKTHEKLTLVCYSTGNVIEYQNIINNLEF